MDYSTVGASILGSTIIAILGYLGVRYTVRGSSKAAADANRVEERRTDIDGFKALLDGTQQRVSDLERQVRDLQDQLQAERSWRSEAVRYMRSLLRLLHEHAPDVDVPEPPVELDLQLTYRPRAAHETAQDGAVE